MMSAQKIGLPWVQCGSSWSPLLRIDTWHVHRLLYWRHRPHFLCHNCAVFVGHLSFNRHLYPTILDTSVKKEDFLKTFSLHEESYLEKWQEVTWFDSALSPKNSDNLMFFAQNSLKFFSDALLLAWCFFEVHKKKPDLWEHVMCPIQLGKEVLA